MAQNTFMTKPFPKSRLSRTGNQLTNTRRSTSVKAAVRAMGTGSGSRGTTASLTRQTHRGSGSRGTLQTLVAGTRKTGSNPRPSMMSRPLRGGASR